MLYRIKKAYPNIDMNWLVYGEGEMFLSEVSEDPDETENHNSIKFDLSGFSSESADTEPKSEAIEEIKTEIEKQPTEEDSQAAVPKPTALAEKAASMGPKKEDSPLKLAVDKKLLSKDLRNNYLKSFGNNGWLYKRTEADNKVEMLLEVAETDMEPTIANGSTVRAQLYSPEEISKIAEDPLQYEQEIPFFSQDLYGPFPTLLLVHPQLGFHLKRLVGIDENKYLILEGDHKNAGRNRMKAHGAEFWIVKEIIEA